MSMLDRSYIVVTFAVIADHVGATRGIEQWAVVENRAGGLGAEFLVLFRFGHVFALSTQFIVHFLQLFVVRSAVESRFANVLW